MYMDNMCGGISLAIYKTGADTGAPLPGAVFELTPRRGCPRTGITGADGCLRLRLSPKCAYVLREVAAPTGYMPSFKTHTILTDACGGILVDGVRTNRITLSNVPLAVSAPPSINAVYEDAQLITGQGVPGSTIALRLPDGSIVSASVDLDGTWRAPVPAGLTLTAGAAVSAVQTEACKLPSPEVLSTVLALAEPFLEKTYENLTTPGQTAGPGDTLLYTVLAGNLGGPGSVWTNAVITDELIEYLAFIPGTVAIDGQAIPSGTAPGQYTYDAATRTLTIYAGDIASGQIKAITFEANVTPNATGEIVNTVSATRLPI